MPVLKKSKIGSREADPRGKSVHLVNEGRPARVGPKPASGSKPPHQRREVLSRCSIGGRRAARRLLLRSAFKQPVADLLRYEAFRPLPCLVIVTAELEVLSEHDALGCCIDGSNPHNLHQRA
jgi:hypothetical protein